MECTGAVAIDVTTELSPFSLPYVRPIVRGKASKRTEFGAKLTDGLAFVDHIRWGAFKESKDLKQQAKEYKMRYGYYPEVVSADQLYGSRENRKYLKGNGIRFGGKPWGERERKRWRTQSV